MDRDEKVVAIGAALLGFVLGYIVAKVNGGY